jgi:phosphoserine aminotransferase
MSERAINFNAGPAALPRAVLELARDELLDFEGTGMSIMEHSHRGDAYERVHHETGALLRELMGISADSVVLFLQGGASGAFATVPMNFLRDRADYAVTGGWGEKALAEAKTVGDAADVLSMSRRYVHIPPQAAHVARPGSSYLHITTNNTLEGTQYERFPDPGVPLVADMSSDILSRRVDVSRFAMLYAGAQKNLGPSGVTVFVIQRAFLDTARTDLPSVLRFATHAAHDGLYHTPPTFGVYLMRNVLRWVKSLGGVEAMERRNEAKARALYAAIDARPDVYRCPVEVGSRSRMNVVFYLPSTDLDDRFVAEARAEGIVGIKGHRAVGGLRASLYNAVELSDVQALTSFMRAFADRVS